MPPIAAPTPPQPSSIAVSVHARPTGGARAAWEHSAVLGGRTAIRQLALADEQDGNLPDAIAAWVRLPPQDPQALAHLGLLALARGDVETARAGFVAARATPNAFADDLVDQGFVALAARPFAGARDFADVGYDLLAAGMPGLAVAPLRTAVARDPSFGDAHSFLGWALWQRGAPEQAEARHEIATGLRLAPGLG